MAAGRRNYAGGYQISGQKLQKNGVKTQEWFSSTIRKYITTTYQTTNGQNFSAAFNDGSGFDSYIGNENQFFIFYCIDYKYCKMLTETEILTVKQVFCLR